MTPAPNFSQIPPPLTSQSKYGTGQVHPAKQFFAITRPRTRAALSRAYSLPLPQSNLLAGVTIVSSPLRKGPLRSSIRAPVTPIVVACVEQLFFQSMRLICLGHKYKRLIAVYLKTFKAC